MAVFAISITKSVPWRGQVEEFSNVYHYNTLAIEEFADGAAIDELVAAERPVFANTITFRLARTWGPIGQGQAASVTRVVRDLTGPGTASSASDMYVECATLIEWPLGRYGSRNRRQFLRKWLHARHQPDGAPVGWLNGTVLHPGIAGAELAYVNRVTSLDPPGIDGPYELCSPGGQTPIGPATIYPYLEHRQFRR